MLDPEIDQDFEELLAHKAKGKLPNNFKASHGRCEFLRSFLDSFENLYGLLDPGRRQVLSSSDRVRVLLSYKFYIYRYL